MSTETATYTFADEAVTLEFPEGYTPPTTLILWSNEDRSFRFFINEKFRDADLT